jgi:antirestriction protein ArdC
MKIEQAKQLTDQALDELIQALEAGKSETLKAYLAMMSRFHSYSFANLMLIAFQRPSATRVAGFQAWKSLGRFVKKGEKGIVILAPIVVNRKNSQEATEEDGEKETTVRRFKPVFVWAQDQTDGKPIPELTTVQGDPGEYTNRLKAFVAQLGISLEYSKDIAPAKGLSHGGRITLLPDLSPAENLAVLVHELCHELMHKCPRRAETTRTIRETEAEAVAFVVCQAIGLESNDSSADYITLWNGNKETLMQSLQLVQQTASQILSTICSAG